MLSGEATEISPGDGCKCSPDPVDDAVLSADGSLLAGGGCNVIFPCVAF